MVKNYAKNFLTIILNLKIFSSEIPLLTFLTRFQIKLIYQQSTSIIYQKIIATSRLILTPHEVDGLSFIWCCFRHRG